MNIDERIEALTQSVELLSQMHQDNEKRYAAQLTQLTGISESLARIAQDHEHRIEKLENGQ